MPLKRGYSRKTVGENVARMTREGYPQDEAIAASIETGRRAYRRRHPRGRYPAHLKSVGPGHRPLKRAPTKYQRAGKIPRRWKGQAVTAKRRRKATPAQLRALAKGRRTLARRRKNPARGKFYDAISPGAYQKARAIARGRAAPVTAGTRINPRRRCNPAAAGYIVVSLKPGAAAALQYWNGAQWGTAKSAARYSNADNALKVARKCKRFCAVARANTAPAEIRAKMQGK